MTFAKRPDDGTERPYRSNLIDLTVLSDEVLRRRRTLLVVAVVVFAAMFVVGCLGLAANPRTIGQISLVGGAFLLGLIMTGASIGGLVRIRTEFRTRAWTRRLAPDEDPDRTHWPDED